ncbi:glycosyl hydrolase 115 family protein [Pinibacter aurantiacus]|uniref:Glycosyl hydrolase 115 family protein n=1 Tax=Pinibacter aurantiacus TaxID=2851599 RepID=A0A9E2W6Q9_9BACT|nr:glycosyl hydrolase 115 family protein [Pinibacter aurantiacus]MBV4360319.1 glycosyl hydrolase 115 family protein [Pinibacter aurantiacus]
MKKSVLILFVLIISLFAKAQNIIATKNVPGNFSLQKVSIYTDEHDDWLIQKAASLLQQDIEKVTGNKPSIVHTISNGNIIVVGMANKSAAINELVKGKKISIDSLQGRWDAYQVQLVNAQILVITGSDKRGVAYGVFELSKQLGVSPWNWWADVPVTQNKNISIQKNAFLFSYPSVKYRGIFLNDEAPALSGWTKEKFGGFNHLFYEHVFELLLRLKGNYLWPAMWGNAFNDDDSINPILANKYGIVMGTSHHEPMMRAHDEWRRYGSGKWNYDVNSTKLDEFWKKGIQRNGNNESIVAVGMRGDGDEPMSEQSNIALLEKIVARQRAIIEEVTGKRAEDVPQMWALYKEVQEYYDKGMRVPDDVTLLLCDDNWGNIRKLPKLTDKPRKGGYGIYYHFDYVGDPRNYKWLNTNQIERTWEQMHLAYEYGAKQVWIVNVGDLKPMEFPISFFLDYAWKPEKIKAEDLPAYTRNWAQQQFGKEYAASIANILTKYTQYNARRKPELLNDSTFSLLNYNEFQSVTNDYNKLLKEAEAINRKLPSQYSDAYFQLVLHPVKACANLYSMYLAVAKNKYFAEQKEYTLANVMADSVAFYYANDARISKYYNDTLAGGKWQHMMDQTHIGYTYWQQPDSNKMPQVVRFDVANKNVSFAKYTLPVGTEKNEYAAFEANRFTKAIGNSKIKWQVIPNIGRTGDGITPFPVTASVQTPKNNAPHLEYEITTNAATDSITVSLYFSPTLNFHNDGLRYAVSIDDATPQVINIHEGMNNKKWGNWVANNIIISNSKHPLKNGGKHVVKYWMVDAGLVLQKVVVDFGGVKQSYLGPPEN